MLSARALAKEIEAGRLTPKQALAQGEAAVAQYEDAVQCFSHRPDKLVAGKGPLRGIAIGIKDIFDTRDMPTGYGSAIYPKHQPATDAALVSMLRRAGATIAGKTVTTEFAWFSPGPTRNPYNPKHTPGGSSSGSAAGVAAGMFPAAIGSQTGGSIVRPAAFCGVSGFKPSFRLLPTIGMKQFSWSLDTAGFFAASAADVAFVAAACSGRDLEVNARDNTPPRIGIYKSAIDNEMASDMASAIKHLTKLAEISGTSMSRVREPSLLSKARLEHATIQDFESAIALADEYDFNPKLLTPKLRAYLKAANQLTPQRYDDARRTANHARNAAHDLFKDCDVLLVPSAPSTAPRTLKSTGDSIFNRLWTLLGLPCVNVPGLTGVNGLPLGVQIIAPFGKDKRALQAAHWLEEQIQLEINSGRNLEF